MISLSFSLQASAKHRNRRTKTSCWMLRKVGFFFWYACAANPLDCGSNTIGHALLWGPHDRTLKRARFNRLLLYVIGRNHVFALGDTSLVLIRKLNICCWERGDVVAEMAWNESFSLQWTCRGFVCFLMRLLCARADIWNIRFHSFKHSLRDWVL